MNPPLARSTVRPVRRPGIAVAWLLWLLIALMPLRALSQELMAGPGGRGNDAAVVAPACHGAGAAAMVHHDGPASHADHTEHAHHGAPALPMHAADAAADAVADGDAADPNTPAPACHACDLCHAAIACPATPVLADTAPRGAERSAGAPRAAVNAPRDGIFKPPRG